VSREALVSPYGQPRALTPGRGKGEDKLDRGSLSSEKLLKLLITG
jgi:hypothetical protein